MNYEEKSSILNYILYDYSKAFDIIDKDIFIDALIESNNISKYLEISDYKLSKQIKSIWPDRPKGKLLNFILSLIEYKNCTRCESYLPRLDFRFNKSNSDGLNPFCKYCHSDTTKSTQSFRQANYRASKIQRTPSWANLDKISDIYKNCPEGYHVDHIYPLNGTIVCGLHVEDNLQYLLAIDNIKKGNRITQ